MSPSMPPSECRLFEVKVDRLVVFTKQLAACGAAAAAGSSAWAVPGEPRPQEDLQHPRLRACGSRLSCTLSASRFHALQVRVNVDI